MILVDTSVLIDLFKDRENEVTRRFRSLLQQQVPFGITSGYLPRDPARGKNIKDRQRQKETVNDIKSAYSKVVKRWVGEQELPVTHFVY